MQKIISSFVFQAAITKINTKISNKQSLLKINVFQQKTKVRKKLKNYYLINIKLKKTEEI